MDYFQKIVKQAGSIKQAGWKTFKWVKWAGWKLFSTDENEKSVKDGNGILLP